MKITRTLKISSFDQFYQLIKEHSTLVESSSNLLSFCDSMFAYYNGCRCLEENFLQEALIDFEIITKDSQVIQSLKEYFECEQVIFI